MKRRKGSLLVLVLILLAALEIMTLVYTSVVRRYSKVSKRSKAAEIALNYAEEGLNNVINILMHDPDWDFRTAGAKSPDNGFPNTVPYSFNFEDMHYRVEVLNQNNNPITDVTGAPDPYFNTQKTSIWVKITGFYYPHDNPEQYKTLCLTNGDTEAYLGKIVKRTIVAKISAAVPINPFEAALFSCGQVDGKGHGGESYDAEDTGGWNHSATVDGDVCAPTITGIITINGDTNCAPTAEECESIEDALTGWANDICEEANDEGHYYTDSYATINPSFSGLNDDGKIEGNYCFEGDVKLASHVEGVDPIDLNGDEDYSDTEIGEVPPPILIVKGNLKLAGHPDFKGIILVMGDYTGPGKDANKIAGHPDFEGTIISFDSIDLRGHASVAYKDFSKYVALTRNKVSRSAWIIGDKPIKMNYNGNDIVVTIAHLDPPNPKDWQ